MAVLVTGGAGYIGSHMVWELLEAGEEVMVYDRLSTGFRWAVAPEAELVVGDLADAALLTETIRSRSIDAVIHFAGSIIVPESMVQPLDYYLNNTVNSRTLIEAAVKAGVPHFIFSSTAAVYGPQHARPISEESHPAPESPYGSSKWMTEIMLRDAAAAHGIGTTILRYFNVAGADPAGRTGQSTREATHLIKIASETALGKRDHVDIYGTDYPTPDGTCVRDYIHVSDLARVHRLALERMRQGGGNLVANCGYDHGYSVREVLSTVERVSGRALDIREAARRPGDPATLIANAGLARREFGWQPAHDDLDEIVAHALAWEERLLRRNT